MNGSTKWGGLAVPPNEKTDKFEDYPAVALFVQHARRSRAGYTLTSEERSGVARLCRLVEGMPLGLELAATWVRMLSSKEIADQIEQDVHFLAASLRDLPERHHGMHAVFDQSWEMLAAEEQRVLSRLSVFRGGFERQAAEQVAGASLAVLASLIGKSLVRRTESNRYDLHELIRQYASTRLSADGAEEAATRDRNSEYYLAWVKRQENQLCSRGQKGALVEMATEIANIREALDWAIDSHQIARLDRVSFVLLFFHEIRRWYREGELMFQQAAGKLEQLQETDPHLEAKREIALLEMRTNQAYFVRRLGKPVEAYAMHRQCTERLRALGDKAVLRYSLRYGGLAAINLGGFDEAEACLRQDLELSQAAGRPWDIGISNAYLGQVARARGAFAEAQHYYGEGLAISRRLGDPRLMAFNLDGLSFVLLALNQPLRARELLEEALSLAQETDDRYDLGITWGLLGQVAQSLGESAKARTLFEQGIALLEQVGDVLHLTGAYVRLAYLTLSVGELPEAENLFRRAAGIATRTQDAMSLLDALAGLATLEAKTGSAAKALELASQVRRHPAASPDARVRAERLCGELEARLTPEQVEAIKLHAQAKTLDLVM